MSEGPGVGQVSTSNLLAYLARRGAHLEARLLATKERFYMAVEQGREAEADLALDEMVAQMGVVLAIRDELEIVEIYRRMRGQEPPDPGSGDPPQSVN